MAGSAGREVSHGDGNGWVIGDDGSRRWGRFGAAGLLLRAPDPAGSGEPVVLLQHRANWTAAGGTWALPGGALDSHEHAAQAALRETEEEAAIRAADVRVRGERVTATMTGHSWSRRDGGPDMRDLLHRLRPDQDVGALPGDVELPPLERDSEQRVRWSYTTVVADAPQVLETVANNESLELRWVRESEVASMPLMPAFARSWESELRTVGTTMVVDVANLLGSVPDGWWRDRAGHTTGLLRRLADELPRTLQLDDGRFGWIDEAHVVVEGAARDCAAPDGAALRVHRADGCGDDELVAVARGCAERGRTVVVVTADRGLRERLPEQVAALGPSVLDCR